MHFSNPSLLALVTLISYGALPGNAQYVNDAEFSLIMREALPTYDFDPEDITLLEAREKTWLEKGFDAAKTAVPYAAGHVNLPEARHNLGLGVAGKVLEKIPTPQQLVATQVRNQQQPTSQRIRESQQRQSQEDKSRNAEFRAQIDATSQGARESRASLGRELAADRQRLSNGGSRKIKARSLLRRRMLEQDYDDAMIWV